MPNVHSITDNSLSFYRTLHEFERYGEFATVEEFCEYCNWAKENQINLYILGNGSNTLFFHKHVQSLILKNKLEKYIKLLPENRLEVSSSSLIMDVLKYCYENSLDSFYYLASVPATVGGALAMNAGRGRHHNLTIYDFVESVNFFDFKTYCLKSLEKEQIVKDYRETIFTGIHSCLILSVIFRFNLVEIKGNPIAERYKWSKEFQDYSAPNCGSVFKEADNNILKRLKGLSIGKARFSPKTTNWILNNSNSSMPILALIAVAKLLHFIIGKKAITEIVIVD